MNGLRDLLRQARKEAFLARWYLGLGLGLVAVAMALSMVDVASGWRVLDSIVQIAASIAIVAVVILRGWPEAGMRLSTEKILTLFAAKYLVLLALFVLPLLAGQAVVLHVAGYGGDVVASSALGGLLALAPAVATLGLLIAMANGVTYFLGFVVLFAIGADLFLPLLTRSTFRSPWVVGAVLGLVAVGFGIASVLVRYRTGDAQRGYRVAAISVAIWMVAMLAQSRNVPPWTPVTDATLPVAVDKASTYSVGDSSREVALQFAPRNGAVQLALVRPTVWLDGRPMPSKYEDQMTITIPRPPLPAGIRWADGWPINSRPIEVRLADKRRVDTVRNVMVEGILVAQEPETVLVMPLARGQEVRGPGLWVRVDSLTPGGEHPAWVDYALTSPATMQRALGVDGPVSFYLLDRSRGVAAPLLHLAGGIDAGLLLGMIHVSRKSGPMSVFPMTSSGRLGPEWFAGTELVVVRWRQESSSVRLPARSVQFATR